MPGFGKRMEDDQVPEWSTEYVPYKAMMKQLDKLVARMAAEEQDRHLQENVATTGGGAPKPTLRGAANAPAAEASIGIGMASGENAAVKRTGLIDVAATDSGANAAAGGVNLTTTIVGGTTAAGDEVLALGEEKRFFEQLDESLKRVVTFYSARVDIMRGAAAQNTGQVSHLKSEALRVVKMPKGADTDAGGDLKRALTDVASSFKRKMGGKKKVDPRKAALQKAGDDARMLRKAIEESYRAINMLESYVSLNMEAFSKIVKKHDKMTGWQTQDSYMRGLKELRVFHDDEVQNLRGTMESAYLKVEEVICVLEPDRWNRVVRGKRTGRKSAAKSGPLGFYEVRRRRNELLAKLRNETKEVGSRLSSLGPRFQAGLALGIAFALGAMLVTRVSEACGGSGYDTLKCDAMAAVAPAVRAPFLIALHVALYGVATQAWIETKVNAPFIFQARRGTELSPTGAVLAGSLAASVWCVVSMVLMYAAEREATHTGGVYPTDGSGTVGDMRANHLGNVFVGALVGMIAMFFMFFSPWPHAVIRNRRYPELQKAIQPLQHPPDSTRRFFLNALMRAAQAPFRKIRMVDFFLADQFVSQTKAMTDILVVFFLACNWTSAVKYASIISLWPNWCRFTQVLRRYRDNTAQWIHLVNAGKYATGLTAGIAGLCLKYAESHNHGMGGAIVDNMSALRVWYNTMSYAGILYGAAWDFFQDWSVFRLVNKENGWYKLEFFKRRMMCKRVELYYFAVVFNSVLRNKWIYASLSAVQDSTTVGDEVWATIWSAAEVIRRCFWNYFRVENEHATNCGMFRATLDVPLPYADGDLTDEEEEEEEEEQTKKPEREKPKGLAGFRAAARTVALSRSLGGSGDGDSDSDDDPRMECLSMQMSKSPSARGQSEPDDDDEAGIFEQSAPLSALASKWKSKSIELKHVDVDVDVEGGGSESPQKKSVAVAAIAKMISLKNKSAGAASDADADESAPRKSFDEEFMATSKP